MTGRSNAGDQFRGTNLFWPAHHKLPGTDNGPIENAKPAEPNSMDAKAQKRPSSSQADANGEFQRKLCVFRCVFGDVCCLYGACETCVLHVCELANSFVPILYVVNCIALAVRLCAPVHFYEIQCPPHVKYM